MTHKQLRRLTRNFSVALAIILIWRGIWYVLDIADTYFFGSSHIWTAIGGIIVGILILYLPDKDLDELGKL